MAYDPIKAAPSQKAHEAAAALDKVYEAVADGLSLTDLAVLPNVIVAIGYLFEQGISKGEAISRAVQVTSLVERDNSLLAGAIPGPLSG